MDLTRPADLAPHYRHILEGCQPFLISYRKNWDHLDLEPFGLPITKEHLYCPTTLRSRGPIDDLHRLDSFSFGPQEMLMPRWVLFDCGEFPGIVFGFGKKAADLPTVVRDAYQAEDPQRFVPLSMWVAIPCAEPGAWFGHNLSSANLFKRVFPGLATITKAVGMRLCRVKKQYGATQWDSGSIGVHMTLGDMELLSAWTPAHTHIETLAYLIDVDEDRLVRCLMPGWSRPVPAATRHIDSDDHAAMQALHADIEAGRRHQLARIEKLEGDKQRVHVAPMG